MPILVDTGPIYALADRDDDHHEAVTNFLSRNRELLIVPVTVLPEACYLLRKLLGRDAEGSLVRSVAAGELRLERVDHADLRRIDELLAQYGSSGLDFVDSSVVAVAERLAITQVLTVDRRHFGMVRPRHCSAFALLP